MYYVHKESCAAPRVVFCRASQAYDIFRREKKEVKFSLSSSRRRRREAIDAEVKGIAISGERAGEDG